MLKPYISGNSAHSHTRGSLVNVLKGPEHKDETAVDSAICSSDDKAPAPPLTFEKLREFPNCKLRSHQGSQGDDNAHDGKGEAGAKETGVIAGSHKQPTQPTASTHHHDKPQTRSTAQDSMRNSLNAMYQTDYYTAFPGHGKTDGDYNPDPYSRIGKLSVQQTTDASHHV